MITRGAGRIRVVLFGLGVIMIASVALDEIGVDPVDSVHINGSAPLHAAISPRVGAVPGTIGRIINAIPAVATATPGVHSAVRDRHYASAVRAPEAIS